MQRVCAQTEETHLRTLQHKDFKFQQVHLSPEKHIRMGMVTRTIEGSKFAGPCRLRPLLVVRNLVVGQEGKVE